MKTFLPIFTTAVLASSFALAQTPSPQAPSTTPPSPPAAERMTPPAGKPDTSARIGTPDASTMSLTEEQAKNWVGKTVYSSDNQNLGEVAAFERDSSGKVLEMHADIGGFLGIGEQRVRVLPTQFKMVNDRIVLSISGADAKSLPQVAK